MFPLLFCPSTSDVTQYHKTECLFNYASLLPHAGGEDYVELNREMVLSFGNQRRCVGIIILEDSITEEDETFQVVIEGLDASTIVTIRDDGMHVLRYNNEKWKTLQTLNTLRLYPPPPTVAPIAYKI